MRTKINRKSDSEYWLDLILVFFVVSAIGWLWEVFAVWFLSGTLGDRGFLHGPWLPIYGCGSVLMIWMKEHLLELKAGRSVTSPKYDFVTCISDPNGDFKKPAKVVLTEGLYVLNNGLADIMDVKVYVFTPLEVIKDRWYKRAALRGKTGTAADMQFQDVNKTAQEYIRPNYQIADAVINGMVSQEYIRQITDKIFKVLHDIDY